MLIQWALATCLHLAASTSAYDGMACPVADSKANLNIRNVGQCHLSPGT